MVTVIYMRIHEIFNVTDERDRNANVEFLSLFCHFDVKSFGLGYNTFNYRMLVTKTGCCTRHLDFQTKLWFFNERCENVHVTGGHFGKKCHFDNTPAEK